MDLDDGVMINSAALWPFLDAQWKDPKKWWKELVTAEGRTAKAYAWELRLQDEIRPDFLIEEEGASAARKRHLKENPDEAAAIADKEKVRRERKAAKADAEAEGPGPEEGEE